MVIFMNDDDNDDDDDDGDDGDDDDNDSDGDDNDDKVTSLTPQQSSQNHLQRFSAPFYHSPCHLKTPHPKS